MLARFIYKIAWKQIKNFLETYYTDVFEILASCGPACIYLNCFLPLKNDKYEISTSIAEAMFIVPECLAHCKHTIHIERMI